MHLVGKSKRKGDYVAKTKVKLGALVVGSLVLMDGYREPVLVLETREANSKLRIDKNTWLPPSRFMVYVPPKKVDDQSKQAAPQAAPCCTSKDGVLGGLGGTRVSVGDTWSKCFTCRDTAKKVAASTPKAAMASHQCD
jgi:hypothetical protein